jgi:hypothetical protein
VYVAEACSDGEVLGDLAQGLVDILIVGIRSQCMLHMQFVQGHLRRCLQAGCRASCCRHPRC